LRILGDPTFHEIKNNMITNLQLRNLLGAEAKNCTDNELSQIREILTSMASIECEVYCQNRDKINAATSDNRQDISPNNFTKLAA
jgi:hypothetical protein